MRGWSPRWGQRTLVAPALVPREDEAFTAAPGLSGDVSGKKEATTAWGAERRADRWAGAALGAIVAR